MNITSIANVEGLANVYAARFANALDEQSTRGPKLSTALLSVKRKTDAAISPTRRRAEAEPCGGRGPLASVVALVGG